MFPGSSFGTPVFINYGQDDNPASTADGPDQYAYAISNDGWAYDGNYEMLGRVPRSKIGDLNAADWQFYTGPPGGEGTSSASWSSDVSEATHILTAPHQLDQGGVQYLPGLHRYILTTGYYPFNAQWPHNGQAAQSTWTIYQAPHPWRPWTRFRRVIWAGGRLGKFLPCCPSGLFAATRGWAGSVTHEGTFAKERLKQPTGAVGGGVLVSSGPG